MSLILDALSRAERDRQSDQNNAPTLLSQSPAEQSSPSGPTLQRRWVVVGSLVLVASAAIVLTIFMRPSPQIQGSESGIKPAIDSPARLRETRVTEALAPAPGSAAPRSAPVATNRRESAVSAAQVEAARVTAPDSPVGLDQQARIDALYDNQPEPEVSRATAAFGLVREVVPRDPASNAQTAAVDGVAREDTARQRDAETENPDAGTEDRALELAEEIDLGAVLAEVRRETQRSGLSPNPVPMLADMPKRFRDSVPTLIYARHNYNAQGGSRVTINGTALGQGQRTRNVEVREILTDSVILRYDGTDFRLRSLNSWVNL